MRVANQAAQDALLGDICGTEAWGSVRFLGAGSRSVRGACEEVTFWSVACTQGSATTQAVEHCSCLGRHAGTLRGNAKNASAMPRGTNAIQSFGLSHLCVSSATSGAHRLVGSARMAATPGEQRPNEMAERSAVSLTDL